MDTTAPIESVTVTDILDLASWNRPRSNEELLSFINTHASRLPSSSEIE